MLPHPASGEPRTEGQQRERRDGTQEPRRRRIGDVAAERHVHDRAGNDADGGGRHVVAQAETGHPCRDVDDVVGKQGDQAQHEHRDEPASVEEAVDACDLPSTELACRITAEHPAEQERPGRTERRPGQRDHRPHHGPEQQPGRDGERGRRHEDGRRSRVHEDVDRRAGRAEALRPSTEAVGGETVPLERPDRHRCRDGDQQPEPDPRVGEETHRQRRSVRGRCDVGWPR